jgi:hypothetical protein
MIELLPDQAPADLVPILDGMRDYSHSEFDDGRQWPYRSQPMSASVIRGHQDQRRAAALRGRDRLPRSLRHHAGGHQGRRRAAAGRGRPR